MKYGPGKPSGIFTFVENKGIQREFRFYPHSRVDGMIRRVETIGKQVG